MKSRILNQFVNQVKSIFTSCLFVLFIFAVQSEVYSQVVLTEGFESSYLPTGWSQTGTAANTVWSRVTTGTLPTCSPHSGTYMVRFNSYNVCSGYNALITQPFSLAGVGSNTPTVSLYFYRDGSTSYPSTGDSVSIYINTSASLTGATYVARIARARQINMPTTQATAGWYQYTFNIPSAYTASSPATNYLLFKGITACGDNQFMDDLSWTSYPLACSGTPTTGTASTGSNLAYACSTTTIPLILTGYSTGSGISFQWQKSPTGANTWTAISGATTANYNYTGQTAASDYRCAVTCSNSSQTAYSNAVTVNESPCYCSPAYSSSSTTYKITTFNLTGTNSTSIADGSVSNYSYNYYADRTGVVTPVQLQQGAVYSGSFVFPYGYYLYATIWIDFNDNGTFETSENVTGIINTLCNSTTTTTISFSNLTIPITASTGLHRMRVRSVYTGSCTPPASIDPCTSYTYGEARDYMAQITAAPACSGTPTAGTASSSVSNACPGAGFNLSISGYTIASGITIQWQSSPSGANSWSNISGATNLTYASPAITQATDFRCAVTCSNSSTTSYTNTVTVNVNNPTLPYTEGFESITANNQLPNCMTASNFTTRTFTYNSAQGSYGRAAHTGNAYGSFYYPANDYFFTPGIYLTGGTTYLFSYYYVTDGYSGWLTLGARYGTSPTAAAMTTTIGTDLSNVTNTTYQQYQGQFTPTTSGTYYVGLYCYGNSVPYYLSVDDISLIAYPNCSGAPTAGTASAPSSACSTVPFALSLSGYTTGAAGITFQWQSSPSGQNNWSNISGATTPTYNVSQTSPTDYQCIVSCTNSSQSATSNSVTVSMNAPTSCYCTPSYYYAATTSYTLNNFSLSGANSTSINDNGAATLPTNEYDDRTSVVSTIQLQQGATYSGSLTYSYTYYMFTSVWIDFNDDGIFQASENINGVLAPACGSSSYSFTNFAIPLTANLGVHRMRVRCVYASSYYCTFPTYIDPCAQADASSATYYYGDTRDYFAQIVAAPACTGTPTPGTATATTTLACPGTTFNLNLSGTTVASGLSFQWQSSPSGANVWANMPGATTIPYTVSNMSSNMDFRCVVTCNNTQLSATSSTVTVNAFNSSMHYFEGFESITAANQLPNCVSATNLTTRTFTYTAPAGSYNRTAHTGNAYGSYYYPSNDYFFTPALNFTAGVTYKVKFWYITDGYSGWTTLGAYYGTTNTAAAMTTAIGTPLSSVINTTYAQFSGTFTPPTSGTYFVGIYCLGTSVPYYLSIDDISVTVVPTITGVTQYCAGSNLSLTAYSAASNPTYSWTGPNGFTASTASISIPNVTTANSGNYVVTVTSNGIAADPVTTVVVVNPIPTLNTVANYSVCNGGTTGNIAFGGTGTSYAWTNNNTAIGLAASGTGTIPSFAPVNTGYVPTSATLTVTPQYTASGFTCTGTPQTFTITDNPVPSLSSALSAPDQCNNITFNYTPTSLVTAATFAWTRATVAGISNAAGSGTNNPAEVLTNTGSTAATVTYVYTSSAYGCNNNQNVTVSVKPDPTLSSSLAPNGVCNGATFAYTPTSAVAGTSYSWSRTAVTGITPSSSNGTGGISEALTNSTNSAIFVSYAFTNTANGCSYNQNVITAVNPTPTVNAITSFTACNGTNTSAVVFGGAVSGTVYNWTNDNTSIGLAASGSTTIAPFNVINTGTGNQVANISVTPVYTNDGAICSGTPQTFTITVYPTPTVSTPANQTNCNGTPTAAVSITGSGVAGTTYSWANNNSSIGLGASGSATIPVFTAVNTSTSPVSATITLTPLANGCTGAATNYSYTVNPTPNVTVPVNQSVCNTASTSSLSFSGLVSGTNFTWANTTTSIGLSAGGLGTILPFTATNTGNTPVIATISVSPSANNCTGTTQSFTITVNPTPVLSVPSNQTICNGFSSSAVVFNSNVSGSSFTWNNNTTSIGLGAAGSGNIAVFTATNPGTSQVVATVQATPTANTCVGATQNFTYTVNPSLPDSLTINSFLGQTICINQLNTFSVNSTVNAGTSPSYQWQKNGVNVGTNSTVYSDNTLQTNDVIVCKMTSNALCPQPLIAGSNAITMTVNTSILPSVTVSANPGISVCSGVPVTYTAVQTNGGGAPSYQWKKNGINVGTNSSTYTDPNLINNDVITCVLLSSSPCAVPTTATSTPITMNIKALPVVTLPSNQTYCNSIATGVLTFSSSISGSTYTWVNNNTAIGLAASGSTNIPVFTTANGTTSAIQGLVTVTPSANGCVGASAGFFITINPTATFTQPSNVTLCNNSASSSFGFSGATVANTTYTWANNTTSIGLGASGSGSMPYFSTSNTGNAPVVATVTVTPTANGCAGTNQTFTYTVNPTATVNAVGSQFVCNGAGTTNVIFGGPVAGATYSWVNNNTSIGLAGAGSGNINSFIASNSTLSNTVGTIIVTPSYNGCPGSGNQSFSITVVPAASMSLPNSQMVCNNGTTVPINFSGASLAGAIYNWSNNNTSIGLGTSGTGNIAAFTAVNSTNAPVVATINVAAAANGCNGVYQQFTITVNPTPVLNTLSNVNVCSNNLTNAISFGSNVNGTGFSWANNNTNIGLAGTGFGTISPFLASNSTVNPISSTITVTPIYSGCYGTAGNFTLTVNPTPGVNVIGNQFVCNNATQAAITPGSTISGATFSWTNSNTSIGLAASGNNTLPAFTALNSGTSPVVANISVSPTANGCTGSPENFIYQVNPTPTVNAISNLSYCSSVNTAVVNFSGAVNLTTYTWSNNNTATGLAASGTGTINAFATTNTGTSNAVSTVTVTPTFGGCAGTAQTFNLTVYPNPTVNSISPINICNGSSTSLISFGSPVSGSTYSWTNTNVSFGLAATGSGNIAAFVPVNTGYSPVSTNVTVTATANGCSGTPLTFTITDNPIPSVNALSAVSVCNNATSGAISFTGSLVAGTTYNWSNTNTAIGLAAAGSGTIASFLGTNSGTSPISGNISVLPSANGCNGTAQNFTLTVNPTPALSALAPQTVCNGTNSVGIGLSGSAVSGTTYSWTNTNSSIGLASSGSGNVPVFLASNTSGSPITATVTATATANSCSSAAQTAVLTINPSPTVTGPTSQTVCGNSPVSISFGSNIVGTTFSWTNNTTSIGLAGSGTGNISGFNAQNSTNNTVTATIAVLPSPYINAGATCTGATQNFTIAVVPAPTVNAISTVNLCAGVYAPVLTFSGSSIIGQTYNWTNNTTSIGLAPSGTGNIPSFYTINTGSIPVTAAITVTPVVGSCSGTPLNFNMVVNPSVVMNTVTNQSVCNGNTYTGLTFGANLAGVSYSWTNNLSSIGLAASGNGNLPSFTAINNNGVAIVAGITVTPSINGCNGAAQSFNLTVTPTPNVSTVSSQTVCAGSSVSAITFSGTFSGTTYSWINNNTATGLAASGTGNIAGFSSTNSSNSPISSSITVTPTANGCNGNSQNFTITVNPVPTFTVPQSQTICNGAPVNAITFGGAPVNGTTFGWTNSTNSIGLALSGTGNIASFNASNSSNNPVTATVSVTPMANGCNGSVQTFGITVNPTPTMNTLSNQTLCNNASTAALNFTGPVTGTTYSWVNNATGIGLGGSGSGNIASFVATNAGTSPVVATVSVTPTANSCNGTTQQITLTVNPALVVNVPSANTACAGSADSVLFTANVGGATYSWTNNYTNIGLAASGTGNIPAFTAVNPSLTSISANIIVTPSANGCTGQAQSFSITIKPTPMLSSGTSLPSICDGGTMTYTPTANISGSSISWTRAVIPGLMPLTGAGSGNISEVLHNTTNNPLSASYAVTTGYNGCSSTQYVNGTVKPTPALTSLLTPPAVCSNTLFSYTPTSGTSGTVFSWSRAAVIGISNAASSGTGNISETLIDTSTGTVNAIYVLSLSANGCTNNTNYNVVVPITIPVSIATQPASTLACTGAAASFSVAANGSNITYQWQENAGSGFANISNGGIYGGALSNTLSLSAVAGNMNNYQYRCIVNGACNSQATSLGATLTVNANPVFTIQPVNTTACESGNANLSTTVTGNNLSYQWQENTGSGFTNISNNSTYSGATTNSLSISGITVAMGAYHFRCVVSGPCVVTTPSDTVVLNVLNNPIPTVTANKPLAICSGDSITFTTTFASGYSFQWNINGSAIGGATAPTYTVNSAGNYTVTVTNNLSCVATSAQQNVTVNPLPASPISILYGNLTFCLGDSVVLGTTSNSGNTYQWLRNTISIPGATNVTYAVLNSGNYQVRVSNGTCTSTSTVEAATALSVPADTILYTGKPIVCGAGGSCLLSAVAAAGQTYAWYVDGILIPGANAYQYTADSQAYYNVSISNSQGCAIFSKPLYITRVNNPSVNISAVGQTLYATPGYVNYTWYLNSNAIPGAITAVYNASQNGSYTVSVTDTNGCTGMSDVYVVTGVNVKQVHVNAADISIYPNPATAVVHINAPVPVGIVISSIEGKEVLAQDDAQIVDISKLPNGIYMLKVFDADKNLLKTERLIKNNW